MTTEPFRFEIADQGGPAVGVATVWLSQGDRPVVVMDSGILDRLDATLDALPSDLAGFVLASDAPRAFVAGADLRSIMDMPDDELDAYLERGQRIFGRIASMPCPTAAAIHGAALGGGFELAAHCDGLIGKPGPKPYPIGLPECGLNLCPGWGGSQLLPARIDPGEGIAQACSGRTMLFDEATDRGLFDAMAGEDENVAEVAGAWCLSRADTKKPGDGAPLRWIGREDARRATHDALRAAVIEGQPAECGRAVLDCVNVGLESGWAEALHAERKHLVALRSTDAARASIEAFFAKSAKK
ncbi:MAG: enoyl-CoA hydratase/isomerase family protein [Phycisphaerales bacterium JB040]